MSVKLSLEVLEKCRSLNKLYNLTSGRCVKDDASARKRLKRAVEKKGLKFEVDETLKLIGDSVSVAEARKKLSTPVSVVQPKAKPKKPKAKVKPKAKRKPKRKPAKKGKFDIDALTGDQLRKIIKACGKGKNLNAGTGKCNLKRSAAGQIKRNDYKLEGNVIGPPELVDKIIAKIGPTKVTREKGKEKVKPRAPPRPPKAKKEEPKPSTSKPKKPISPKDDEFTRELKDMLRDAEKVVRDLRDGLKKYESALRKGKTKREGLEKLQNEILGAVKIAKPQPLIIAEEPRVVEPMVEQVVDPLTVRAEKLVDIKKPVSGALITESVKNQINRCLMVT